MAAGAAADLVLVEGDPLEDIGVLADSSNIKLVIKQGLLAKVGVIMTVDSDFQRVDSMRMCLGAFSCC